MLITILLRIEHSNRYDINECQVVNNQCSRKNKD